MTTFQSGSRRLRPADPEFFCIICFASKWVEARMLKNENTVICGERIVLIPYRSVFNPGFATAPELTTSTDQSMSMSVPDLAPN